MSSEVDVVVVGAGAAGLAAAKTALSLGLTVQVFEAADRIGGRADTEEILPGMPWDRGAYWLHDAERNALAAYAAETGIAFDESPRHFYLWGPGGWADETLKRERDAYYDAAFAAIDRAGEAGLDVAASTFVPPHPRFQAMFESWYAALNGAEPAEMSTLDDSRYRNGGNWRVKKGYGALVAAYGKGLPVRLSTPVGRVRWDGAGVNVETAQGAIRCRVVIVTASTTALVQGAVRFAPELPAAQRAALEAVPVGTAEKVCVAFRRDVFGMPENSHLHFVHDTPETMRFHIKPGGHPIAVGYVAGRFATELETAGSAAMADYAERTLANVFGTAILKERAESQATRWRSDPYIRGGYSYARPGASDLRQVLMQPIAERIFLAGEACSIHSFGTVHGAHNSGVAAARAAHAAIAAERIVSA